MVKLAVQQEIEVATPEDVQAVRSEMAAAVTGVLQQVQGLPTSGDLAVVETAVGTLAGECASIRDVLAALAARVDVLEQQAEAVPDPPVEEPPAEDPPAEDPPAEEEPGEEDPGEPEPVDAVVSAWSPWGNPTEWVSVTDQTVLDTLGTASAETRMRTRTRTVLVEAQNGGTTPPLYEERDEYRFTGQIPVWGNENFDARAAREDCIRAVALRSKAQIDQYRHANLASALPAQGLTSDDVQFYDPAIDACRFVLPPGFANIEQSWIGFGSNPAPVRLSVVWEVALSESWRPHIVGDGFKFLQIRSTGGSSGKIWVEPNLMSGRGAPTGAWCISWLRLYSSAIAPDAFKGPFRVDADGTLYRQPYPAGVVGQDYGSDQLGPVTRNVYLPVNTPTKVLVDLDVTGQPYGTASQIVYLTYAVRIAEDDPIVIIDRAPITLPMVDSPAHADIEANQSQPRPSGIRGRVWASFAGKNITMHRNCAEPVALLVA